MTDPTAEARFKQSAIKCGNYSGSCDFCGCEMNYSVNWGDTREHTFSNGKAGEVNLCEACLMEWEEERAAGEHSETLGDA